MSILNMRIGSRLDELIKIGKSRPLTAMEAAEITKIKNESNPFDYPVKNIIGYSVSALWGAVFGYFKLK